MKELTTQASNLKFAADGPRKSCVKHLSDTADLIANPTVVIIAIVSALTAAASYFVSEYILNIVHTESVFLLGSYVTFTSYFILHYYLVKHSSSYQNVDEDKQFYVLSNLIKTAVLAAMTPSVLHLLYETLILDEWHSQRIHNIGCMYCIPDFVSLLLVNHMTKATKGHHICVCIFSYLSRNNDYAQENICRLMVVYGIFSTLAFLVNFLLASRFLNVSRRMFVTLSILSLIIYASACAFNWAWQVYYVARLISLDNHWSVYVYCALLCVVVYDDIVLNKWLIKNISRSSKDKTV